MTSPDPAQTDHGKPSTVTPPAAAAAPDARARSKLARLCDLLRRPEGASLAELAATTGWQPHSLRGAMSGALRKKGYRIGSETQDGVRRYHNLDQAEAPESPE